MQHLPKDTTKQVLEIFSQLGLTLDHAYIYIANLEIGTTTASKLAKVTDLPRSTTYDILNELSGWRFVVVDETKSKALYTTCNPNYLLEQLTLKKNRLMDLTHDFDRTIYQLEAVYAQNQPNIPKIRYISGEKDILTTLKDAYLAEELLIIDGKYTNTHGSEAIWPTYLLRFLKEGEAKGIKTREILYENEASREYIEHIEDYDDFKVVLISKASQHNVSDSTDTDIFLYDGTVAYLNHNQLSMVTITDENIYNTEKTQFEQLWNYYQGKYGIVNHSKHTNQKEPYLIDTYSKGI